MNNDPFKVFLQTQRSNQEINEIAALQGLLKKGIPNKAVPANPAGKAGAGILGNTRANIAKASRAAALPPAAKQQMLSRGFDPAATKDMPGRSDRLAKAAGLQKKADQSPIRSVIGTAFSGIKKGALAVNKQVQSLDTPRNRELGMKAVRGIGAFVKQGGFSSGFNNLYKNDITTGYPSAGGILAPNRLIGVGSADNDQTAIDNRNARDGTSIRNSSLKGLSPTERRQALQRGAAD